MKRLLLAVLAATLLASPAAAFNSLDIANSHVEGRAAARTVYNSEHKEYFSWTLIDGIGLGAGAPWNQSYAVWVPAGSTGFPDLGTPSNPNDPADPWTLIPVHPTDVQRLRIREVNNGAMFAELPDFAYTFYDWWTGNETCPPSPAGANGGDANVFDECYEFAGWMGALNTTHFSPQARTNWLHYHDLALGIAAECSAYHAAMGYASNSASGFDPYLSNTLDCGVDGLCPGDAGYTTADIGENDGVDDFLEQCQLVSLWLEANGHHYFEDSWSSGHMWGRWGSPQPAAYPSMEVGLAVAMTSGTIHGAKGGTGSNDRMCSGGGFRYAWGSDIGATLGDSHPAYSAPTSVGPDWQFHDALGDYHFTEIKSGSSTVWAGTFWGNYNTVFQYDRMLDCAISSVREVYAASPQIFGAANSWSGSVNNPRDARCHAQRATNGEMYDGSKLDYGRVALSLDSGLVYGGMVYNSGIGAGDAATLLWELTRIRSRLGRADTWDSNGFDASTNTERYALGNLMGISSNELNNALPTFADPSTPWDDGTPSLQEGRLLNAFNRSFAPYWCEDLTRSDLNDLRGTCQNSTDPLEAEAACQTCEEFSARHIRIGCSESDYDATKEPLCALVADDPSSVEYLYIDLDETGATAQDAGLAAAEFCRSTNPSFGPCVDAYLFGDYDTTYCSVVYYPYYMCLGCGSCVPIGTALAMIGSPYDEEDLSINWMNSSGGYPAQYDQADTPFVFDQLFPGWCGMTATGFGSTQVQVCDPFWNCTTSNVATATTSCYGY